MPKLALFHIDVLNDEYMAGWCFHRLRPWRPARLRLTRAGGDLARASTVVECGLERKDVIAAGLHRSGRCGFLHVFDPPLSRSDTSSLQLSTAAGLVTLIDASVSNLKPVLRSPRPVLFMHIPKTAGTSFNNHVQSWYGYDKWHIHIEALSGVSRKRLIQPAHYVAGHLPLYRIREQIGDLSKVDLHTIVREPVAQLHSHLAWLKGIGSSPGSTFLNEHPPAVQKLAHRMQSLALHDAEQITAFVNQLEGFELDFFDNIQTRYFLDYRPQLVDRSDVKEALSNRSLFATIGLTENYRESIERFGRYYGREPEPAGSRHNPSKIPPLFDQKNPAVVQALRPLIQFDQLLYSAIAEGISHGN